MTNTTTEKPKKPRKKKIVPTVPEMSHADKLALARVHIKFFYDMQKMRIGAGNRNSRTKVDLDSEALDFLTNMSSGMKSMEDQIAAEVDRYIGGLPIAEWLTSHRGISTITAGLLLAYTRPAESATVSKLWRWCGLAVIDGVAERRQAGVKAAFNPWLKSKVLYVIGGSFLKSVGFEPGVGYFTHGRTKNPDYVPTAVRPEGAEDITPVWVPNTMDEPTPAMLKAVAQPWVEVIPVRYEISRDETVWRAFYDNYKHRKCNTIMPTCMGCEGTAKFRLSAKERERIKKLETVREKVEEEAKELDDLRSLEGSKCKNCGGTGRDAPWGRSDAHRHNAALRYMVKMFLAAYWEKYRTIEGLPVRPPYAQEYLGLVHHA